MNQPSDSPRRVRRPHGMSKAQVVQYELDRATPDGSCLITKANTIYGYGQVKLGGINRRLHRLVLEVKVGRQLDRQELACHVCDNRGCINPDHLYIGSHADNMRDRYGSDAGQAFGESHHNAKLSNAQVSAIRERHAAGGVTLEELAQDFDISFAYVSQIINRKRRMFG